MLETKTETTAMQRLGHVFGWIGNGTGGLVMLSSLLFAAFSLWNASFPDQDPEVGIFVVEVSHGGKKYAAIGSDDYSDQKVSGTNAVRKHVGEESYVGGDWSVIEIPSPEEWKSGASTLEKARVKAAQMHQEKQRKTISGAQQIALNGALVSFLAAIVGILMIARGQSLRYVLAGSFSDFRRIVRWSRR